MTEVQVSLEQRVAELESKLDSMSRRHTEFEKVHVSRRGPEGGRGETGPVGPPGPPVDIRECVEAAKKAVHEELQNLLAEVRKLHADFKATEQAYEAALSQAVILELLRSGVIDAEGRAVPGPAGHDGADSTVAGPKGDSVTGPAGRDGIDGKPGRDAKIRIGSVSTGDTASATLREADGIHVLDFVLPRGEQGPAGADSTVPGPKGDRGEQGLEGERGIPGPGLSRDQVIALVLDMRRRGTI